MNFTVSYLSDTDPAGWWYVFGIGCIAALAFVLSTFCKDKA